MSIAPDRHTRQKALPAVLIPGGCGALLPLTQLFPSGVATAQSTGEGEDAWLYEEELASVRQAGQRRRREFALGRGCARHVLMQLGHAPSAISANPDRSPKWPAGIVGSISHCRGHAAAVAAQRETTLALGLDLERVSGIDLSLAPEICTHAERGWLQQLPTSLQRNGLALLFCAKEAFYKCQFPLTRRWLEFTEVSLRVDQNRLWVETAPGGLDQLPWSGRHAKAGDCMLVGFSLPRAPTN